MDGKKLITRLEMLMKGKLLISETKLSIEEIRNLWTEYNPNHNKDMPTKKFTDYIFSAVQQNYRSCLNGKNESVILLGKSPHAFMLGQEIYGPTKTVAVLR